MIGSPAAALRFAMRAFVSLLLAKVSIAAPPTLADAWEVVPRVVDTPDWHLWGSSPVLDEEGEIQLFVARWPADVAWEPGWRRHSEIARYRAAKPEGPFEFIGTVLEPGGEGWEAGGVHNPCVRKVGDRYAMFYISNDWNGGLAKHGPNQRIGLRVAKSLDGPWRKVTPDGMILQPGNWCAGSGCGVNNPAFVHAPDGRFLLYFKARPGKQGGVRMGVAVAERLEGPYVIQTSPITANDRTIEDGTAFLWGDKICLITTDNHGIIERGGGLLWVSDDGLRFREKPLHAFHPLRSYLKDGVPKGARMHYGGETKFERPQMLTIDGKPSCMFLPSGTSLDGDSGTDVHLLRPKPGVEIGDLAP